MIVVNNTRVFYGLWDDDRKNYKILAENPWN